VANRRMVAKKISLSEQVNDLSDTAALAYTWAIVHADDWGIVHAGPRRFKAEVVPLRDWTVVQVEQALDEMVAAGLVVRYWHAGEPYIWFPTFADHQEGLQKRTRTNGLPHPQHTEGCYDAEATALLSEKFREVLRMSRLSEQNRTEQNRTEQNNTLSRAACGGRPVESQPEPTPEPDEQPVAEAEAETRPKHTRTKTRADIAFEGCLKVYGVEPSALDTNAWATYAKAMNAIVAVMPAGLDALEAWEENVRGDGRALGPGAKPEKAIPAQVRLEVSAEKNQRVYDKAKARSPTRLGPQPVSRKPMKADPTTGELIWDGAATDGGGLPSGSGGQSGQDQGQSGGDPGGVVPVRTGRLAVPRGS